MKRRRILNEINLKLPEHLQSDKVNRNIDILHELQCLFYGYMIGNKRLNAWSLYIHAYDFRSNLL